ncbi:type IV secretion system protein [Neisseria sp. Ec49-e6-T10]|uniref:type IV secretion system protein n=1 Tax=Neisseria sp. Ec49-e6-T10 TaxID=3140744 RepID=UPI003EBA8FCA
MSAYFSTVADALLNGMGTNLFAKSANIISGITPLFAAGFGLYILLVMMSYYNRGLDENIMDFSKRMIGWLVIIACAFNAGTYNKLANLMYEMPEALSGLLGTGEYSASALDTNINNFVDTLAQIWGSMSSKLSITDIADNISILLLLGVILILGVIFFAVTAAFYLVAKLSLAMVILVGPIFIGAMLFPATRQWGMNWIGQIFNYTITIVFYVILGSLQQDFFINHMALNPATDDIIMLIPTACIFITSTMIFLIIAWNVPSIASALTGGASIGGITRTMTSIGNKVKIPSLRGGGASNGGSIKRN